jgi:hypothetical protein
VTEANFRTIRPVRPGRKSSARSVSRKDANINGRNTYGIISSHNRLRKTFEVRWRVKWRLEIRSVSSTKVSDGLYVVTDAYVRTYDFFETSPLFPSEPLIIPPASSEKRVASEQQVTPSQPTPPAR